MSKKRFPAQSGTFYPGSAQALRRTVESFLPDLSDRLDAIGLLVPHAGYVYSGRTAGAGYAAVREKDIYVIIGPNHTGLGEPVSIMTEGEWIMPTGTVRVDPLAKKILAASKVLTEDFAAHEKEHSIEVHLPFIKYVNPSASIVPIALMDYGSKIIADISGALAAAIAPVKDRVLIVASSDLTHYEPQDTAKAKDMKFIDRMLSLDPDGMTDEVKRSNISACGWGPVAIMLKAALALGASKAKLIGYSTSGDASMDYSEVVGYAALAVY